MINDGRKLSLLECVARDENGSIFLSAHTGSNQIVSHEEAQQIINELIGFYASYRPEQVDSHNISAEKNWLSETYSKRSEGQQGSAEGFRKAIGQ